MTSFKSDLDETLDDDIWKDSFDRLLNKRSLLRELNVLKNKVRLSYNNDSSVETSTKSICKQDNVEDLRLEPVPRKRTYESISTPITTNKLAGPFDCTLSPISAWRLTHFNNPDTQTSDSSSKDKSSLPIERVTISNYQSTPTTNHISAKLLPVESRRTHMKTAFEDIPEIQKCDSISSQTDFSVVKEIPSPKSPTPPTKRTSAKLLPAEPRRTHRKTAAFHNIPEIQKIGDSIAIQTDVSLVKEIPSPKSPTPPTKRISANLLPAELRRTQRKTAFEIIPEIQKIGDSITSQTDVSVGKEIPSPKSPTPPTKRMSTKLLPAQRRRTHRKTAAFEDIPETQNIGDNIASQIDISLVKEIPSMQSSKVTSNSPSTPPPTKHMSAKLLPAELRRTHRKTAFEDIPEIHIIGDSIVSQTDDDVVKDISSLYSEPSVQEVNTSVVLPPGKWRKSLSIWKRSNHLKDEYCDNKNKLSSIFRKSSLQRTTIYHNPQPKNSRLELLRMCEKHAILPFSVVYSDTVLRRCRKIGEGTYGEVFLNKTKDGDTVLKIIPIEGDLEINGEPQKNFEQILPEVIITNELSNLRMSKAYRTSGFVFLKKVYCVKGKYPAGLIELWNLYDKNYGSENDHPEVFSDDQLYVVLEVANGGKDLDGYTFKNADQANAAFSQVMCSLAVAEKSLEFEHRDLHCGNILIQPTTEKHVKYTINNIDIEIPTSGVLVTIIDYTLSRMLVNGCCYYNDLSTDEELFCAKGDYQYDIYRLMKTKLRNDWEVHDAYTNVLWLHYMSTKLTGDVKYKFFRSKQHLQCMKRMKTTQDTVLSYNSAFDLVSKMHLK